MLEATEALPKKTLLGLIRSLKAAKSKNAPTQPQIATAMYPLKEPEAKQKLCAYLGYAYRVFGDVTKNMQMISYLHKHF